MGEGYLYTKVIQEKWMVVVFRNDSFTNESNTDILQISSNFITVNI